MTFHGSVAAADVPGPIDPTIVADALQRAVTAMSTVQTLASQIHLQPDAFLSLLGAALTPRPAPRAGTHSFSNAELDALEAANVDLDGPAAPVATLRTIVATARQFGESLTVAESAELLRVTQGRVRQRLADHTLHGVRPGSGAPWRLPAWQFTPGGALPGLDRVLAAAGRLHPLALERFMTTPHTDLLLLDETVSPVEWLTQGGDADAVADLIRHAPAQP